MISLYQIQDEYRQLSALLLASGGEVTPEIEAALAINKEELENKAVNYGFVIREMEAAAEACKSEIDRLTAMKQSCDKSAERLKEAIKKAMLEHGIEKCGIATLKISFRKSESVEVDNLAQIPAAYMVEKTTVTPDKTAIKKAIASGEVVPGVRLVTNQNLQIK